MMDFDFVCNGTSLRTHLRTKVALIRGITSRIVEDLRNYKKKGSLPDSVLISLVKVTV